VDGEWVKILKEAAVAYFEFLPRYSMVRSIETTDNIRIVSDLVEIRTGTKPGAPPARSVFCSSNWTVIEMRSIPNVLHKKHDSFVF
jgi:hypothetical protein